MARKVDETKNMTREEIQILNQVSKDPFFFSKFVWVVNPVTGRVKFDLYPYQKAVLMQFLKERFNIILKCRQMGLTELISMFCLWLTMYHPNKRVNIISIKDTIAKKVLKRIKFMYKNLPWYLQTPIVNGRPGEYGSTEAMEFINGSVIESIPTSEQAGRSESLSLLVIDEAAAVRWANAIWASAAPTLSCISGSYDIILTSNPNGLIMEGKKKSTQAYLKKIKDLAPSTVGIRDLRSENLYTLTHHGRWRKVLDAVNKGKLETWEIEDNRGNKLDCTPEHRLLTLNGWKTVREIMENNLKAVFINTGFKGITPLKVPKPKREIRFLFMFGKQKFYISNLGEIFKDTPNGLVQVRTRIHKGYNTLTLFCKKEGTKNWKVSRLVYETFKGSIPESCVIDHMDNDPLHDWVTNLQCISISENTKKAYSTNTASVTSLTAYPIQKHLLVLKTIEDHPRLSDYKISQLLNNQGYNFTRKNINNIRNHSKVYVSFLKVKRVYVTDIYDIHVEEDHSYILPTCNFINHNTGGQAIINSTPLGAGNWYHSMWVDALAGVNGVNPIRLLWNMHPDRDEHWYSEMAKALGPKRTAQEIDGDFLSSGNTVFDMTDIKAIEDTLYDYPLVSTRFNKQYMQFDYPDNNKEYYIGADCATGRGTDYSSFTVMDRDGEESAVYKGRIPLDKYAKLLGDTGELFNWAKIAPETNDIGAAVTIQLQTEGYPNLYYTKKLLRKKGKSRPDVEDVPGWITTNKNRSVIIEGLEKDIREDEVTIKDPFFVQEAYTFIYDGTGRPVAMGKHRTNSSVDIDLEGQTYSDDDIFGKAITNHIRKQPNSPVVLPA